MKLWRSAFFVLFVCLAITATAGAQGFTGQIVGTVTDQTKAVLPGVSINITNTGTGVSREVLTNEAGYEGERLCGAFKRSIAADDPRANRE